MNTPCLNMRRRSHTGSRGMAMIMVLLVLVVCTLLGVGGAQIAMMSEKSARSDRDMQLAWQSAESALMDAELDMTSSISSRSGLFDGKSTNPFVNGCGTSGTSVGLCATTLTGKPAWLTVDFTATGSSAPTAAFGQFTGRAFTSGSAGVQPAKPPRYVIEIIPDPTPYDQSQAQPMVYRVTAMGFGPRPDIQAVIQMIYRI